LGGDIIEIQPPYSSNRSIFGAPSNKTELPAFEALVIPGATFGDLGATMFKIITTQSVAAVAAAAILAGAAVLLTSVAPPANAMPQPGLGNPLDRAVQLAIPATVAACSARSWPNYDPGCLRSSTGELRYVRVINLETHRLQVRAD
jgi:hypothetical protein